MPKQLSQEGEAILKGIGNEISTIGVKFNQFITLYLSGPENVLLLRRSAPVFFDLIGESLFRDIMLSIARLCDPAQSMGQANMTFEKLAESLPEPWKSDYIGKLDALRKKLSPVKIWRHKHLAHNDLKHSLNRKKLPDVSYDDLSVCVKDASNLLNVVNAYKGERHTLYEQVVAPQAASSLLMHLDRSMQDLDRQAKTSKAKA